MNLRQPRVQVARKPDKAFRVGRHGLEYRLIQPYPDWELDEHGAETAERVDALIFVQLHRLLRGALPVALVAILNLLHLRLQRAHRLYLAALLDRERHQRQPNEQREGDYRNAEVEEQVGVQHHQPVYHGLDDYHVPSVYYD